MENVLTVRRELVADYLPENGVTTAHSGELVDMILSNH